ncbi:MAG: Hsp20/alpha crystallin family protein [Cyanobacteria bacterium]|jgi:HSP20 family protein|nr:Hsp20/alpha crystallin family protein [Cyanobacteriota bacterium]
MARKKSNNDIEINKIIEQFLKDVAEDFAEFSDIHEVKTPIIYGFNVRLDPSNSNKELIINSFGNIKKDENSGIILTEEREPLVDIIEKENEVVIIAEIPGVSKENIKIEINQKRLHIDAKDHNRNYSKDIKLNTLIDTTPTSIQFKNGVLEIIFSKSKKEYPPRTITIE